MRHTSIAAVSAVALMTAGALAQTMTPSGQAGRPLTTAPMAPAAVPSSVTPAPVQNPLTLQDVSKITGTDVYGSDDKKIGSISTELMSPGSKTIDRLVVSAGGVLGVGAHHVALPIDKFSWDAGKSGFTLASTADELKSMPQWQEQSASAPAPATGSSESVPAAHTSE